jgi:DNA-binding transcriptional LysR family regulator
VVADIVDLGRLDTVPLRAERLVLAVPITHPLATLPEVAFADCLEHPFIGHVDGTSLEEHVLGHARPLGTRPRYRARFADTASVCAAVAAGIGVAVLPDSAVDAVEGNGVRAVPLSDPWAARTLLLCTRPDSALTPPARMLAEHLTRHA